MRVIKNSFKEIPLCLFLLSGLRNIMSFLSRLTQTVLTVFYQGKGIPSLLAAFPMIEPPTIISARSRIAC